MIPPASRLPLGFEVMLNRTAQLADRGRTLLGGNPTRVLYLTAAASRTIANRVVRVTDASTRMLADHLLEAGMADPVLAALPEVDVGVTFVVPVYGRPAALNRLLTSIGGRHPIIVVDDCSPDRAAVGAVAAAHGARFLRLEENGGPASARNEGLNRVTTPFVAFVDSDIVLDQAATALLLRHFADPRVALVAPRVLGLRDGTGLNWIGRYEEVRSSLDMGRHPATVRPGSPVSWVPGAFLLARVDAISTGFNAQMRAGEDVDLVWRLAEQGWRIRFEPGVTVRHEHRQTARNWLAREAFYGSSAHPLASRHEGAIAPAVFAPWSAAVVAALMAQRRWSVPVAAVITGGAALRIAGKLPRSEHPIRIGASLASRGVAVSLSQTMALLLRHWWPLAAVTSVFSGRVRRAVVVSGVLDAALDYRRVHPRLGPIQFALARRLDDLAYGAGVWFSAIKGRSVKALLPSIRRSPKPPTHDRQKL